MKKTKTIFIAIIFVMILLMQFKVDAKSIADLIYPIEYTEEFKQYLNLTDEEKEKASIIPRSYVIMKTENRLKNPFKLARIVGSTAETSYTLQNIIPENLIVKDQGDTDTCWTFAAISSLETNLALKNYKNHLPNKVYDFSEKHMEYGATRNFLNNQINTYGFNRKLNSGGNYVFASAYLTNGLGAVNEDSMVFDNKVDEIELSQIQNKVVTSQVLDTKEFAKYTNTDGTIKEQIKDYIKNYGGLTACVYGAPLFSDYYNNETGAMYCDNTEECPVNHAVTIVGWDDTYSKDKFNEAHRPTNNGAWIVKNSYGTEREFEVESFRDDVFSTFTEYCNRQGWDEESDVTEEFIKQVLTRSGYTINGDKASINIGDNGYWHVSYEDINIYSQLQGITNALDEINYDNIYQYNYNGAVGALPFGAQKMYLANIFDKKTNSDEYINQVALNVPEEVTCKVYVNANGTSLDLNDLQKVQLQEGESETFDAGYHTLEFLNPVKITGTSFVVMVEIQGTRENELSYSVEGRIPDSEYDSIEVEHGKCFISVDGSIESGEWIDLSTLSQYNERSTDVDSTIKAFTISNVENVLARIEIQTPPTKTSYIEGENFDSAGMKVVAIYENGRSEEITNYTLENATSLQEGQISVKIKYNGKEATQAITVTKAVEEGPIGITFNDATSSIKSLKTYTYTTDTSKNYVLAEIEVTNLLRNLNNDSYEYYYYISTNSSETDIKDWVKINESQTSDNSLVLTINSKNIKNYDKISDAEKVYLYIKEVVTKGENQKITISNGIEIKSKVDKAELYVNDVKYTAPLTNNNNGNNNGKDGTTIGGKLPQTGEGIMIVGAIVIVFILGIIFVKKYIKYNEKM